MIKSTKHAQAATMELYPPFQGLDTINPPDMLSKTQASEFNGGIDDNKVTPTCIFNLYKSGYSKIFSVTEYGKKNIYGYTTNGIESFNTGTITYISGLNVNSSTIPYDDKLLTLSNSNLYLNSEKIHRTEGHNISSTDAHVWNYGNEIQSEASAAYIDKGIYTRGYVSTDETLYFLYRVEQDGTSKQINNERDSGISYSRLFSWNSDLYALCSDGVYVVLNDGKGIKAFDIVVGNGKSKPIVIGDYLYFKQYTSSGGMLHKYSLIDKTLVGSIATDYMLLGGYKEYGKDCLIFYNPATSSIIKTYTYITASGSNYITTDKTLVSNYTNKDITQQTSVAVSNGRHFLYYSKDKFGKDFITAILDIDTLEIEETNYSIQSAVSDNAEQTIYVVGNNIIGTKVAHEFIGRLIARDGRVGVVSNNMVTFSGVGDVTMWRTGFDNDSIFVEIGYKEGGNIIDIVNGYDLIVFKDNGKAYRLSGSYPDWTVKTLFETEKVTSNVLSYGSNIVFGTPTGIKEVMTTQNYGDYLINNIITSINMDNCIYIHTSQMRSSVMYILPDGIYEYKINTKTYTKLSDFVPDMLAEDDFYIYALKSGSVYRMAETDEYSYSYGRLLANEKFLIKGVTLYSKGTGIVDIQICENGYTYRFEAIDGTEKKRIRQIYTTNVVAPRVRVTGDVEIMKMVIEYSVIGGDKQ